jgi:hypothetical protein
MSGRSVAAAVTAIVLATAVLPPSAAWSVNRLRVNRATIELSALAARLRARDAELRRLSADTDVLYGPGQMPTVGVPETRRWASERRTRLSFAIGDAGLSTDPWGNSYLVNVAILGHVGANALWILSAGPNGTIEVPFAAASNSSPMGDDVAVQIR